jgi:hypothetical protein
VTAIAFSVSKPFRRPIWTNYPFLGAIIFILITNCLFVFLPNANVNDQNTDGENWLDNFFLLEPFYKDGVSYYSYRFYIAIGIVVNSAVTILYEKWFV